MSLLDSNKKIFVVSGPTGSGKGTLLGMMKKSFDNDLVVSVSATTRKPRPGEIEGVHYHFVTVEEFDSMVSNDEFLEHASIHGNKYGTPRSEVQKAFEAGKHLILEIDMQGNEQMKGKEDAYRKAIVDIFVMPPALKVLIPRIIKRDTTIEREEIERRMNSAVAEMSMAKDYRHVVINDDQDKAYRDFKEIFDLSIVSMHPLKRWLGEMRLKYRRMKLKKFLKDFDMSYDIDSALK